MSSVLVVYGSSYGQTERIARQVAMRLSGAGQTVALHRADRVPPVVDIGQFDGYLVLASVIRGRHQPYVSAFVRRYLPRLNSAPSGFVSVSGSAASAEPKSQAAARRCVDQFLKTTGWVPTRTWTLGGAMAFTRYNWVMRRVMQWISRRAGGPTDITRDHDLTDWNAVNRLAEDFRDLVTGTRRPVTPSRTRPDNAPAAAAQSR